MSALIEAARYQSRVQADLARLLLENEGIDAVLFDEAVNGFFGGMFVPVRLMVPQAELAEALSVLAEAGLP